MSQPYRLVAILTLLVACQSPGNGGDDGPPVDARSDAGTTCTAMEPRSVAPETFVGPSGLQSRLTALIDGATQTLDIHMYLWTVRALADRVVAAKQRGVAVRVILDPDSPGNDAVRPTLTNGNVPTRNATSLYTFSHAKYMVIDGERVAIMSMNFNVDAMSNERNYGMVDRDPKDVADLQALFDMDWAIAGGEPAMPADLACTRLIVSPNNAKARLVELIESATQTLEVEVMYLSEDTVRMAIGAAQTRGVAVRVILSERSDEAVPYLRSLGVTVKFAVGFFLHAKLIVADGVVFVGSENMSFTSLTKNREVGALVFEPAAAAVVTSQFETDWSGASAN
jgi:phosphatidylserine/phosphatidylglycerophosphate/cardiolipin synthase-like enzyme